LGAPVVAAAVDAADVEVTSPNIADPDEVSVMVDGRLVVVRDMVAELYISSAYRLAYSTAMPT
jgi:hypothetical protein